MWPAHEISFVRRFWMSREASQTAESDPQAALNQFTQIAADL